jgi:hypothetical protein
LDLKSVTGRSSRQTWKHPRNERVRRGKIPPAQR